MAGHFIAKNKSLIYSYLLNTIIYLPILIHSLPNVKCFTLARYVEPD